MLLEFALENWRSFTNFTALDLVEDGERYKKQREKLSYPKKYNTGILPIIMLLGENTAGKSNFLAAVKFVVDSVRAGILYFPSGSPVEFALNVVCKEKPTTFRLAILIGGTIFEYALGIRKAALEYETIAEIKPDGERRLWAMNSCGRFYFFRDEEKVRLFKTEDKNQLLLTLAGKAGFAPYAALYEAISAITVLTKQALGVGIRDEHELHRLKRFILAMDTGITDIQIEPLLPEDIPFKTIAASAGGKADQTLTPKQLKLSDSVVKEIQETLQKPIYPVGTEIRLKAFIPAVDPGIVALKTGIGIMFRQYHYFHGDGVPLAPDEISSGTQKLLRLAPFLLNLFEENNKSVLFIDDFDELFHPILALHLIRLYLRSCSNNSRKQLIFTTRNMDCLVSRLLHLDEKWIVKRDSDNGSELLSPSQYKGICDMGERLRRESRSRV